MFDLSTGIIPVGMLLLEPYEETVTLPSGLVVPKPKDDLTLYGKVVKLGKKREVRFPVRVDDVVVYLKHVATKLTLDGKPYLLLKECDVLFVQPAENPREFPLVEIIDAAGNKQQIPDETKQWTN